MSRVTLLAAPFACAAHLFCGAVNRLYGMILIPAVKPLVCCAVKSSAEGQGRTIVTGQEADTGRRQFIAVGLMLAALLTEGVILKFWPDTDSGAYVVVLAP